MALEGRSPGRPLAIGITVLALMVVVPLGLPDVIARVFLDPDDPSLD